jgi:cytochrome oxidase Cu insertion factor (SCO1/SenC/PrrC family)
VTSEHRDRVDIGQGLSDEERAMAFANTNSLVNADGSPRRIRTPIPSKAVVIVVIVFIVLGLGGAILQHYLGTPGQSVSSTTTTTTQPANQSITASMTSFLGLKKLSGENAPGIALTDQFGQRFSLGDLRGTTVVLAFLSNDCNDLCPVEAQEIRDAAQIVASTGHHVAFVIVNADPPNTSVQSDPAVLASTGLSHVAHVYFLTGPLASLNRVWTDYGITVQVDTSTRTIAHNDVMYFISPTARLKSLVTPFGNESLQGAYSLGASQIRRFAQGIATTAISVAQ